MTNSQHGHRRRVARHLTTALAGLSAVLFLFIGFLLIVWMVRYGQLLRRRRRRDQPRALKDLWFLSDPRTGGAGNREGTDDEPPRPSRPS